MRGRIFAATFAGLFYGMIAAGATAEAARCANGKVYRVTKGVCVDKAIAIRQGVYKPRRAKKARSYQHARRKPAPVVASDDPTELRVTPAIQHEIGFRAWLTAERRQMIVETTP